MTRNSHFVVLEEGYFQLSFRYMQLTSIKNFSKDPHLKGVFVVVMLAGVILTVIVTQVSQDVRSRAALVAGDYSKTLNSSGNIISGSVLGDVIGNSNIINGDVKGCLKGDGNIIGGRVFGTASGTGNVIAGGSGNGPCLSSQTDTTTSYIIYDDALNPGWVNWAWQSNVNFANTSNVHSGSKAITFTGTSGGAGLYLHSKSIINTSTYTHLSFAAKAASTGKRYYVQFYDSNARSMAIGAQLANYGGDPVTSGWKVYNIPLTLLDSKSRNISGIAIVDSSGTTQTLYVDDIKLVSSVATAPTIAPTNTPAPTPTSLPTPTALVTPTPTNVLVPTSTPYPPTPTPTIAQVTATPFPTTLPTATPAPFPTNTPMPTPTPIPGATLFAIELAIHGIGKGGDSANPNGSGNFNILHPQRQATLQVINSLNQLTLTKQGTVKFDTVSGTFKGTIDMGTLLSSGFYTIKVKTSQQLRAVVPGIHTITQGKMSSLPKTVLVSGDIHEDNAVNILDYNILMGCYSDLLPPPNCAPGDKVRADLTDDGKVNQFDYNLFMRELTSIGGQ